MNDPNLWKNFKEKPASQILPQRQVQDVQIFEVAASSSEVLWKQYDPHMSFFYEKGAMLAKGGVRKSTEYEKVLQDSINCFFQLMREEVGSQSNTVEERQKILQNISAAELVFKSGIEVVKNLNLKLDINLIISIMYGYIMQCAKPIAKDYEDRQSTKH